jgi:hypothetical protein
VAICSSDVQRQPQDGATHLAEQAERAGFGFPYLIDETQEVARPYGALSTPEFFLFDRERQLVYRGGDEPALRAAVESVAFGEPVSVAAAAGETSPIVWKPGNEPGSQ